MNLLKCLCATFAVLGAYMIVFGGQMIYTGREYGMALLALAVTTCFGGNEDG